MDYGTQGYMKSTFWKYLLLLTIALGGLQSCNDEVAGTYGAKPIAMGRLNDMVVIADDYLWDGMPGDTFKHYYESAYPIMPNPEPMFDLRHFTTPELEAEALRKELRTYVILADLSDKNSATTDMVRKDIGEERYLKALKDPTFTTTVGKDKWARGQVIIYLFGKGESALAAALRDKFTAVAERVRKHDEEQLLASIYTVKQENAGAIAAIKKQFGIDIKIPGDYDMAIKDEAENIVWLKRDDNESSSNIIIRAYDYKDKDQLDKASALQLRDEYGKQYISGPTEGSYMVTNDQDLPVYDYTYDIAGMYTREFRGIWEMEGDFMGGPFVTYLILDQERGKLIFVDTFVYAPGKSKRNLVQQLDYVVRHATKADQL